MKYLLDTHVFIWMASDPAGLSRKASSLILDTNSQLILSLVSVWEMQIKSQLGKLELELPLPELVGEQQATNRVELLPITLDHLWELGTLPPIHRDPFDRLLIAQSRCERIQFLTADGTIPDYDVDAVW